MHPSDAMTAESSPAQTTPGVTIRAAGSDFGQVLFDGIGQAIYLFDKETTTAPDCYGDCAAAWPPYIVKRRSGAGQGVSAGLIGTTKRSDGRLQATYAGKPLYYYVSDSPGNILCQDVEEFGGHWYVVKSSGKPVL